MMAPKRGEKAKKKKIGVGEEKKLFRLTKILRIFYCRFSTQIY